VFIFLQNYSGIGLVETASFEKNNRPVVRLSDLLLLKNLNLLKKAIESQLSENPCPLVDTKGTVWHK
jgi:hypothetical protein